MIKVCVIARLILYVVHDSITERFFPPGPRTKLFKRFFIVLKTKHIKIYVCVLSYKDLFK